MSSWMKAEAEWEEKKKQISIDVIIKWIKENDIKREEVIRWLVFKDVVATEVRKIPFPKEVKEAKGVNIRDVKEVKGVKQYIMDAYLFPGDEKVDFFTYNLIARAGEWSEYIDRQFEYEDFLVKHLKDVYKDFLISKKIEEKLNLPLFYYRLFQYYDFGVDLGDWRQKIKDDEQKKKFISNNTTMMMMMLGGRGVHLLQKEMQRLLKENPPDDELKQKIQEASDRVDQDKEILEKTRWERIKYYTTVIPLFISVGAFLFIADLVIASILGLFTIGIGFLAYWIRNPNEESRPLVGYTGDVVERLLPFIFYANYEIYPKEFYDDDKGELNTERIYKRYTSSSGPSSSTVKKTTPTTLTVQKEVMVQKEPTDNNAVEKKEKKKEMSAVAKNYLENINKKKQPTTSRCLRCGGRRIKRRPPFPQTFR